MLVTRGYRRQRVQYDTVVSIHPQGTAERDFGRPPCCNYETPLLKRDFITVGAAEISVLSQFSSFLHNFEKTTFRFDPTVRHTDDIST